ncbi:hypothetical protein [Catenulispora sp. GAS73]|uniref:hypothetical protein n=1 Tax=Catenulispora sp. GAS73 TaxID=3156269 RepID=UPI003517EC24
MFQRPPLEDPLDDECPGRIDHQPGFALSLCAACRYWMRDLVSGISVRRLADVEALPGVFLEAAPRLLQHVQHVPLSYALLHSARENLCGALCRSPAQHDRLVRGQQGNPGTLQPMLDERAVVRPAGDAIYALTDHRIESGQPAFGFGEQVLDTAVARYGDVQVLVASAFAPIGEIFPAGLDIVEVRDDHSSVGQGVLTVAELARDRDGRVLLVLGRCPGEQRDADVEAWSWPRCCRRRDPRLLQPSWRGPAARRFSSEDTHSSTSITIFACSIRSESARSPVTISTWKTTCGESALLNRS